MKDSCLKHKTRYNEFNTPSWLLVQELPKTFDIWFWLKEQILLSFPNLRKFYFAAIYEYRVKLHAMNWHEKSMGDVMALRYTADVARVKFRPCSTDISVLRQAWMTQPVRGTLFGKVSISGSHFKIRGPWTTSLTWVRARYTVWQGHSQQSG
jgi:hypothetical protein